MVKPLNLLKTFLAFNRDSYKLGNKPIDTKNINPKLALGLGIPYLNTILPHNSPEMRKEVWLQIHSREDLRKTRLEVLAKENTNLTAFEVLQKQFGGDYDFNNFISCLPEGFRVKYTNETFFKAFAEELAKGENSVFAPHNEREAIIALPTGTGKTGIFALIAALMRKDQKVMIIVPTIVLNDQTAEVFKKLYPHKTVSFISSSNLDKQSAREIKNNFDGDIVIIVEDSFRTIMDRMKERNVSIKPSIVILDEFSLYDNANRFQASFDEFIEYCKIDTEKPIILKFSATPYSTKIKKSKEDTDIPVMAGNTVHWLDQNKLPKGKLICQISPSEAIKQGEICNVKWKSVKINSELREANAEDENLNTSLISKKTQLYWSEIINKYIDLYENDIEQHNKKILAVCPFIKNAKDAAQRFCKQTKKVSAVVSSTENCIFITDENGVVKRQSLSRNEILKKYRNNEITAIFNVKVLREGVDFPDIEVIWMMNSINSVSDYLQFVGRGMRLDPNNPNKVLQIIDLVPETPSLVAPLTAPQVFGMPSPLEEGDLLFEEKTTNKERDNTTNLITIDNSGFYNSFISLSEISAKIKAVLRKEKLAEPNSAELIQLILTEADKIHENQDWRFIIHSGSSTNNVDAEQSLVNLYKTNKQAISNLKFNYKVLLSVQELLIKRLTLEKEEKLNAFASASYIIPSNKSSITLLEELTQQNTPNKVKQQKVKTEPSTPNKQDEASDLIDIDKAPPPQMKKFTTKNIIPLLYIRDRQTWQNLFNSFIEQVKVAKPSEEWIEYNRDFLECCFYNNLPRSIKQSLLDDKWETSIDSLSPTFLRNVANQSLIDIKDKNTQNSLAQLELVYHHYDKWKEVFDNVKELCNHNGYNISEFIIWESLCNKVILNNISNNNDNYIKCLPILALANLIQYAEKNEMISLQEHLLSEQKKLVDKNIANPVLWRGQIGRGSKIKILSNSTFFNEIAQSNSLAAAEESLRRFFETQNELLSRFDIAKVKERLTKLASHIDTSLPIVIKQQLGLHLDDFWAKWRSEEEESQKGANQYNFIVTYLCPKRVENSEQELVFDKDATLHKLSNCHFVNIVNKIMQLNNAIILLSFKEQIAKLPFNFYLSEIREKTILKIIKRKILENIDLNNDVYKQVLERNMNFQEIEQKVAKTILDKVNEYIGEIKLTEEEKNRIIDEALLPQTIETLTSEEKINLFSLNLEGIKKKLKEMLKEQNLNFNLKNFIQGLEKDINQIDNSFFNQLSSDEQSYLLGRIQIPKNNNLVVVSFNEQQNNELNSLIKKNYSPINANFVSFPLFCHLLERKLGQSLNNIEKIQNIIPSSFKIQEAVFDSRKNTEQLIEFIDKTKLEEIKQLLQTTETTFTEREALLKIQSKLKNENYSEIVIKTVLSQILKVRKIQTITQEIINQAIEVLKNLSNSK